MAITPAKTSLTKDLGASIASFLTHLHGLYETFLYGWLYLCNRPFYFKLIIAQMDAIGARSLSIVLLTSLFTGMVLALQSGYEMAIYGAKMYVGTLVSLSLVRELGPVLTALVVAGRVGAGISAELGSMKVTEQIDAMRALATNPLKKLVSTRLLAATIMVPVLTIIADAVGIFGGLIVSTSSLGISAPFYWTTVLRSVMYNDILLGLVKSIVFGMIIATVGCYMGLSTEGGTRGVGESTTRSVVLSSILIFICDYLITKLFLSFPG